MLAQFSATPIGRGEQLAEYVAGIMEIIERSGLDYRLTAMSTIVEGDWDEVMDLIRQCHQAVREKSARVLTSITIDDREGARGRLDGKVEDVERVLGRRLPR